MCADAAHSVLDYKGHSALSVTRNNPLLPSMLLEYESWFP